MTSSDLCKAEKINEKAVPGEERLLYCLDVLFYSVISPTIRSLTSEAFVSSRPLTSLAWA